MHLLLALMALSWLPLLKWDTWLSLLTIGLKLGRGRALVSCSEKAASSSDGLPNTCGLVFAASLSVTSGAFVWITAHWDS